MPARSLTLAALTALCCTGGVAQTKPGLDTTTFVVMGEGLAAGMGNFGLSSALQNFSFPAQAAAQMNAAFVQPLIQPPGIGNVVGYPGQEVRLQTYPQGSVRQFYPSPGTSVTSPPVFIENLSVPGFTLADSVSIRPVAPIAQRDMKQTVVNLILGFPQLFLDRVPLWTQFEYAKGLFPTVALIELGYYEALDAAVNLDPTGVPDPDSFGTTYGTIVAGLRALQTQVIVTTIPNPLDTAYFSSPGAAATILAVEPSVLPAAYAVAPQDYLTRNALQVISNQFLGGTVGPLPSGSILTAAAAADLTARINALNARIVTVAKANGALVYDLNAFLHKVKAAGAQTGSTTVTADYLGGFYTLDAVYPGPTGNALIANDLLTFLNSSYGKSFPLIAVGTIAAADPVAAYRKPVGALNTERSLGRPGRSSTGQ